MDKPVGDMTREELRQFVLDVVHSDASMPETVEINGIRMLVRRNTRPNAEILAELRAARVTLPPGSPTPAELLREDRDR